MTRPETEGRAWRRVLTLWLIAIAADVIGYGILVFDHVTSPGDSYAFWLEPLIAGVFFYSVGILIHRRYPRHGVGHAFLLGALSGSLQTLFGAYAHFALHARPDLPFGSEAAMVSHVAQLGFVMSLLGLLFLYPTGHLVSPRWRLAAGALATGMAIEVLVIAFEPVAMDIGGVPSPFAWSTASEVLQVLEPVRSALFAIGTLAALASPIVRYRRAAGLEKLQLRWFAFGASAAFVLLASPITENDTAGSIVWGVAPGLLPVFAGIAILRYRLYDLGLVVRRTVTYTILAGSLVAVYALAVLGLGTLGRAVTGQDSDVVVALSTLAAIALFQPIRTRVQRAVDGRFDRRRHGVAAVVEQFARELRDNVDLSWLRTELQTTAQQAVQPRSVSLWQPNPARSVTVPER